MDEFGKKAEKVGKEFGDKMEESGKKVEKYFKETVGYAFSIFWSAAF